MPKQGHTPIPRYASDGGPAFLSQGFRPFFLLGALWAVIVLPLSLATIHGHFDLPSHFNPVAWHMHEMMFGFIAAVLTGFLLTAIPNWTGRLPLQNGGLLFLVVLWGVGRIAVTASAKLGPVPTLALDMAFLLAVLFFSLREVMAGKNWRNLPIIFAVALLAASNALFHAEAAEWIDDNGTAGRLAIAIMAALIALLGGRMVPSFTRNYLAKRGSEHLPASFGAFDKATLVVTLAALIVWTADPEGGIGGGLMTAAGALNFVRMLRWQGHRSTGEPLVWILHLGFVWLPAGLVMIGLSILTDALPQVSGIHALTAGAMATMILAVMSRATLGHTGRALKASAGLVGVYALITVAAVTRLAAPLWTPGHESLLMISGAGWMAAFGLFVIVCGPMLVGPKPMKPSQGEAA